MVCTCKDESASDIRLHVIVVSRSQRAEAGMQRQVPICTTIALLTFDTADVKRTTVLPINGARLITE